MTVESDRSAR
ncbi:hypothetical protein F383_22198 [Gossypium arboreum]|uniref:Uncharacterized protein n=1 Tax=Gossypium arboreum TaxID=29729 RepID=A0A0B0NWZ5_GOSAR|nr:hypothetical protein F383_22198 [Gossypium arboreum]